MSLFGAQAAITNVLGAARQRTARAGELNHAFVDPYSLAHAIVGALLGLVGLGLGWMLVIAVGWEVAEHILKDLVPAAFPHPTQDTLANSIGDVLAALAGWSAARLLRARRVRPGNA